MERKNSIGMVVAMVALVVFVAAIYFYHQESSTVPTPPATASSTPPATGGSQPVVGEGCAGCVGIDDNGKTIALSPSSRLTILLPSDTYNESALSLSPKGALKEITGVAAPAGASVRAFQGTTPGTATILVPATDRNNAPYAITVITLDAAHAWEDGFVVVTKLDANQTISLSQHERFVIQLGDDLSWSLAFDPKNSISRVAGSVSTGGIQGVYSADKVGTSTLSATGAPICTKGEACPQFRISVPVNFIIR